MFMPVNDIYVDLIGDVKSIIQCKFSCMMWHECLYTLWGKKKLHPFYFLHNSVKTRSMLIIFGTQIPE